MAKATKAKGVGATAPTPKPKAKPVPHGLWCARCTKAGVATGRAAMANHPKAMRLCWYCLRRWRRGL